MVSKYLFSRQISRQTVVALVFLWMILYTIGARSQALLVDFDIKKGPLSHSLIEFARQSGLSVIANEQALQPHQSVSVQGRYTYRQVLQLLLVDTGLGYAFINRSTLVVSSEYVLPAMESADSQLARSDDFFEGRYPIEEVMVTSFHRRENLQDVPVAVSVMDQQSISFDKLASLEAVASRVPGLTVSSFSLGQPTIHMRGVGSNDDGAAMDNSVVAFIDDVYVGRITSIDLNMLDIERIEVLRGSQGGLYGKNSIGGAVKLVTQKPVDVEQGEITLGYGNYNYQSLNVLLNSPLGSDQWLGRLVFDAQKRDGWQDNIVIGGDKQHNDNKWGIRGQLLYIDSEALEYRWSLDLSQNNLNSSGRIPVVGRVQVSSDDGPVLPTEAFNRLGGDPQHATNAAKGYTDRDIVGFNQHINYHQNGINFLSITALRHTQFDWLEDSTGLPESSTFQTVVLRDDERHSQVSQELRWWSNSEQRFSYVIGLHYLYEKTRREESFFFQNDITAISDQTNSTTSTSVYGQLAYRFNTDYQLTLGGRLNYDKKHLRQTSVSGGAQSIILEDFELDRRANWQDVSPQATLSYSGIEDLLVYLSVAKGMKSGGFQGSPASLALAEKEIGPESAWDYEMGLKSQWLDQRLRLNLAAFFMDYRDLQVVQFQTIDNFGQFQTTNAASATVQGVELELTAKLSESFSLSSSYAYLDARYEKFNDLMGRDFTGNHLRQAPQHSVKFAADYYLKMSWASFRLHADYRYQSESYREPDNTVARLPSHYLVDASASLVSNDDVWELGLWSKNLTNEEYISHLYILGGNDYALYGMPRSYGVSLKYNFL